MTLLPIGFGFSAMKEDGDSSAVAGMALYPSVGETVMAPSSAKNNTKTSLDEKDTAVLGDASRTSMDEGEKRGRTAMKTKMKASAGAGAGAGAGAQSSSSINGSRSSGASHQQEGDDIDQQHRRRQHLSSPHNHIVTKAMRFLTNPNVLDLPLQEKTSYLSRKGLTDQEIDEALDAVLLKRTADREGALWDDDEDEEESGGHGGEDEVESDDEDEWDDVERRRNTRTTTRSTKGHRRRGGPGRGYGYGYRGRGGSGGGGGGRASFSRPQRREQTSDDHHQQQQIQPYQSPYNRQQQMQGQQYGQSPSFDPLNQPQQQLDPPPGIIVPLTIGGMVGITAMAALRWLNGGDFVLFPPPSSADSSASGAVEDNSSEGRNNVCFRAGGCCNVGNGDAGIENEEEEEVVTLKEQHRRQGEQQQQQQQQGQEGEDKENSIYEYLDEYLEVGEQGGEEDDEGDEEYVEEEEEEACHTAEFSYENEKYRNGATPPECLSNSLEGRVQDLTTAMEKFVAIQERTLKAKNDEKGREVTNSAMDLLRKSSSLAVVPDGRPTEQEQQQGGQGTTSTVSDVTLAVLMTEMKCELANVKEALSLADTSSDQVERVGQKLDAATASFERLEALLLGGKQVRVPDNDDLPVAANVKSMYETPSRMFETGELSPVPDCKDGDVTALDVSLTLSADQTCDDDVAEDDRHSSPAEEAQVAPIEPVGREALSRAIGILADPKRNEEEATVKACAQMLYLYVVNLSSNLSSKRYRRVYTTNANFKNKVGGIAGGREVLESLGFVDKGSYMEWEGDMSDQEGVTIALLNEAAAQLSILKVIGRKKDNAGDAGNAPEASCPSLANAVTPRHRSETPPPPGAPPRNCSETPPPHGAPPRPSSSGSGPPLSGSSGSSHALHSAISPSGFVTPRMRGDGSDRFVAASPANSVSSANIISPPNIKQLPSSEQSGMVNELFGGDGKIGHQEVEQGLGFPSTLPLTSDGESSTDGIFRTTKAVLPPRAPINSLKDGGRQMSGDVSGEGESIFAAQGSAFMRRDGSSVSEPTGESSIKLKLRRSPVSEDEGEFAPRRASDPDVTHVDADTPLSAPVLCSEKQPPIFNLSGMNGGREHASSSDSDRSNYSPSTNGTLDYTQSPLDMSLLSVRTDMTDVGTPARQTDITEVGTPARRTDITDIGTPARVAGGQPRP